MDKMKRTLKWFLILLAGMLAGIALCKLCPAFWNWLNWDYVKTAWIPKVMFAVGALCIMASMFIKEPADE